MKTLSNFENNILSWYKKHGRHGLPWRNKDFTPYHVWVSEIMLQQTQVNRVIDYYQNFIERFPDIHILAQASWKEFLPYYQGLGYYRRGENMLKTAKLINEKYNGIFPRNKKDLLSLPGIGEYTAKAILSFGYDDNHLAVDTNLKKVFGRYLEGSKDAPLDFENIEEQLSSNKKTLNGALMDFASTICKREPLCESCPLQENCKYNQTGGKLETKKKKQSSNFPTTKALAYVFLHENHKKYFSDKKTFAPFILEPENNSREAIKTYFHKEFGLELSVRPPHKKLYIQKIPVLFIHAQILLGKHSFHVFDKIDKEEFLAKLEV